MFCKNLRRIYCACNNNIHENMWNKIKPNNEGTKKRGNKNYEQSEVGKYNSITSVVYVVFFVCSLLKKNKNGKAENRTEQNERTNEQISKWKVEIFIVVNVLSIFCILFFIQIFFVVVVVVIIININIVFVLNLNHNANFSHIFLLFSVGVFSLAGCVREYKYSNPQTITATAAATQRDRKAWKDRKRRKKNTESTAYIRRNFSPCCLKIYE